MAPCRIPPPPVPPELGAALVLLPTDPGTGNARILPKRSIPKGWEQPLGALYPTPAKQGFWIWWQGRLWIPLASLESLSPAIPAARKTLLGFSRTPVTLGGSPSPSKLGGFGALWVFPAPPSRSTALLTAPLSAAGTGQEEWERGRTLEELPRLWESCQLLSVAALQTAPPSCPGCAFPWNCHLLPWLGHLAPQENGIRSGFREEFLAGRLGRLLHSGSVRWEQPGAEEGVPCPWQG